MMNLRNVLVACALGAAVAGAALPAAAQVSAGIYVQTGPPAPVYEAAPAAPGPGYYWVPGYWTWNGNRYIWTHGRYAYPPYSGATWHPGHWGQTPHGWVWKPGHWGRPY